MIIQYLSDLHLEFPENNLYIKENPIEAKADILILAGDIIPFRQMEEQKDFFNHLSAHFKHVYWLPGNHEYYYADINKRNGAFNESIRNNITLLNNSTIQLEGVSLIFSTLWTNISQLKSSIIENRLSDFFVIKNGKHKFEVDLYNKLHQSSVSLIKNSIEHAQVGKTIVITHHVPTFQNYPLQYISSPINEAFAVELEELIHNYQPDYWIYGHSHVNTPTFNINKTTLLTNQLGYIRYSEHKGFNPIAIIEV